MLLQVSAATRAQKVTLNLENASLVTVLETIKKQTGFNLLYPSQLNSKTAKPVDINIKNADIEDALELCFKGQPFTYTLQEKTIVIKTKTPSFLERVVDRLAAIDVHGRVVDQEGKPLPGATVKIKSTGKSVSANAKGEFYLEKLDESETLVISFIGFVNKEVVAAKEMGNIVLELSDSKLDEIQVTAYGKTTQRLSTGNISTVKAEDIAKAPVANPLLAIAGRVPGVFIQQSSGVPGAGVKIVIQGQNSMEYGNDPFYVIDGVPYTSQLLPGLGAGILGDSGPGAAGSQPGTAGNPLNFINPQDIESIDVLKDADATSIYGSRAAHGAIIITTKKGKAGKTLVNFNVQQGGGQVSRKMKMLNTQQYLEMRKEAFANDNRPLPTDPTTGADLDLSYWDQNGYTDWQKELIGGIAKYTNAMATISGGSSNIQYRFSAGFQRDGTVTPGDLRDQKGSVHFSLNSNSENNRFKFGFSSSYVTDDNQLALINQFASNAYTLPPNAPKLYNEDGTLNWDYISPTQNAWLNPLRDLSRAYLNRTQNLIANATLSYQVIPGLELKSSLGYNKLTADEVQTIPLSASAPHYRLSPFAIRTAWFNSSKLSSWIIEPQLKYVKPIWKGKLDVFMGATIQQEDRDRLKMEATGFTSDESMFNLKSASNVRVASDLNSVILSKYKYAAIFGLINYNINDKYIVNYSIRRDGSSRFGKENKFHDFSSIAGAWIFSNESIIKNNLSFLSFGKVKASFGTTGSDQIGDYSYLNLYGNVATDGGSYQGTVGLAPFDIFPNPYLQWEETKKLSTTINLGFFNDRLLMEGTWYKNRCSNQLGFQRLTSIPGGSGVRTNRPATVQNTGWELGLNTVNIIAKEFKWSSSINLTIPRNKLINITGTSADNQDDFINKPLGVQKVYHFLGVDPETGLYLVQDRNGNPTSKPDGSLDRIVYMDLNPSCYGGFQNSFSYKGLSLEMLFQFTKQKGNNMFFGTFPPGSFAINQPISVLNRWQKIEDQASIQAYHVGFTTYNEYTMATQSDKAFSDASYIRLKNVSLSYQLPLPWMKQVKLQNAKIFMQGQNLLTFTSYVGADPETRTYSGIPPLKVLTLGIQIGL
jgi:TonB-linked SusC/RagA family outer membrane protein